MKLTLLTRSLGIGAVAAFALSACGGGSTPTGSSGGGDIAGSGSTFQATIESQWTSAFQGQPGGAKITYDPVGSGTGQEQFDNGSVAYAGSDVALEDQGAANKRCGGQALTFPVTAGGIAIIYNLPGVSTLKLDATTLAGIFQGSITKWNDPAITKLNPGVSLPSTTITTYHRADSSGTTSVFSAFETAEAGSAWTLGQGETLNWTGGQAASGSSGTTAGVAQTTGGITYAEASYVSGSTLRAAEIQNAKGDFEAISPSTVSAAINSGLKLKRSSPDGLVGTLDFAKMTGYPISTVSYAIVCKSYSNSSLGATVKSFFTYAVSAGQNSASQLHFAPLPASIVSQDKTLLSTIN